MKRRHAIAAAAALPFLLTACPHAHDDWRREDGPRPSGSGRAPEPPKNQKGELKNQPRPQGNARPQDGDRPQNGNRPQQQPQGSQRPQQPQGNDRPSGNQQPGQQQGGNRPSGNQQPSAQGQQQPKDRGNDRGQGSGRR